MAGSATELLLLGHTEERLQFVPLVVLGLGMGAALTVALAPGRGTVLALAGVMALSVAAGLLGLWAHFRGNREFELEMYPSMRGFELVREALTGATPALAPGTMCLLGLLGLIYCYRHPRLESAAGRSENTNVPRENRE
jgi:hypothetical protein